MGFWQWLAALLQVGDGAMPAAAQGAPNKPAAAPIPLPPVYPLPAPAPTPGPGVTAVPGPFLNPAQLDDALRKVKGADGSVSAVAGVAQPATPPPVNPPPPPIWTVNGVYYGSTPPPPTPPRPSTPEETAISELRFPQQFWSPATWDYLRAHPGFYPGIP